MILVIDNYDSFTYNLVQYLGEMGADLDVRRNDAVSLGDIEQMAPEKILLSPGPGTPDDAGVTLEVIRTFGPRIPIFGVCLGQQAIGQALGGKVVRAEQLMHGKTSPITHNGTGVFTGLPSPLEATRYHSLIVERSTLPAELMITAESEDGEIMGIKHKSWPLEGVQFHPESVLTTHGKQMLRNFLTNNRLAQSIPMNLYEKRLSRVRTAMHEHGLDTLILTPGAAMRYLCGFSETGHERLLALIVPDDQPWLFVTPALNASQVRANPAGITDVRVWDDTQGWQGLLREICTDLTLDIGIIGLDDDMPARFSLALQELVPTTLLKLASPVFGPLRAVKDTGELAAMQHAADATDALIAPAFAACQLGVTERDIAAVLQNTLARLGAEASFEAIVGTGANGANPHHHTGKAKVQPGDVIVLDFGAKIDGYHGDITRTVAVGSASDEARRVYETVYQAQAAAVDAVRPGATGHDIDAAARDVITNAGYGEFFIHRTGHGIGLDDHETPYIVAGNRGKLVPGNCFSIEPGIYLPGKFGVRLENIVSVTENGTARAFNQPIPPELPILED